MEKIKRIILLFTLVLSILSPEVLWSADNDFQLWMRLKYSHPFSNGPFTVYAKIENRFDQNLHNYLLFFFETGFDAEVLKWFKPGFFIRFQKARDKNFEIRLIPEFHLYAKLGIVKFSDRNRFTFRLFTDGDTKFLYRNRIKLGPVLVKEKVTYHPWISEEIFIQAPDDGFYQNRLAVGSTFGFFKDHFKFMIYYMLKHDKVVDGWNKHHILGTELGFHY